MGAKQVKASRVSGATTSYVTLINITGESGELKSIGIADGIQLHYFKITIDQNILVDEELSGTATGNVRGNTSLTIGLRFDDSLLVEARGSVKSPQTVYWAVVTTDSSKEVRMRSYVRDIDDAPYRFEETTYERGDGTSYNVTTLIGPEKISELTTEQDVYQIGEPIRGRIVLRTAEGAPLYETFVPIVVRPAGYQRAFPVPLSNDEGGYGLSSVDGSAEFELNPNITEALFARLARLGPIPALEIVADLPTFANYPARFRLM
jgi:hypothetical protein